MEDLFKQKLLILRAPPKPSTFAEALLGTPSWATRQPKAPQAAAVNPDPGFSEKVQVIESLERFTEEKLEETKATSIKVEGGEIGLKAEPTWSGIEKVANLFDLRLGLSLDPEILDLCLENKTPGKIEVMFVSENFRTMEEIKPELKSGIINQLLPAFPFKTAELFGRMIAAMKLNSEEVMIYPSEHFGQDLSSEVMKVAGYYKPQIIVTLGAKATHKILKGQERLAMVHGQFFNRKIENIGTFLVVPLFHPSIIENNQNMKKTAWADMQKIMKHLKKL